MPDQEPTVFNGRYELHRQIARGGMADVFLARDQLLNRPVAIKVLFPQFASDASFVERFRREAQSAANLNHPNIVSVYDWGQEQGTYFIVMEYVDGRSLAEILRSEGMLHPDRAADIATDVAAALSFAHRNGTVHRDIKPGNILIAPSGQVKVTDFGIARAFGGAGSDTNLTQTGSVMGTATYFSPEQAQGKAVDPRSDLYSLGVVLYEMLASRPPFSGDSPVAIAYQHVQEQPVPPSRINPNVPASIEAVTMRLLAKEPTGRYPSAEDLRADLRRFREGQPVLALGVAGAAAAVPAAVVPAAGPSPSDMAATSATPIVAGGGPAGPDDEYYDDYDEPPSRTGWFLAALVILLLVLAGLLVLFARSLGVGDDDDPDEADVEVPTVIDLDVTEATRILDAAGFIVDPRFEENEDFDLNVVFNQEPRGGTFLAPGSTVVIFVSSGTESFPMPELIGSLENSAIAEIERRGLVLGNIERVPDDIAPDGEVIGQSPSAGDPVAPGSVINLRVSTGPEQVAVPDVAGATPDDARSILVAAGFSVLERQQASNTVAAGLVIGTSPASGEEADKGSAVTIFISTGPNLATVPSVLNQTQATAESVLTSAGFNPQVSFETSETVPDGRVISQSPESGESRPVGSSVSIVVSSGPAATTTTTTEATTTTTEAP